MTGAAARHRKATGRGTGHNGGNRVAREEAGLTINLRKVALVVAVDPQVARRWIECESIGLPTSIRDRAQNRTIERAFQNRRTEVGNEQRAIAAVPSWIECDRAEHAELLQGGAANRLHDRLRAVGCKHDVYQRATRVTHRDPNLRPAENALAIKLQVAHPQGGGALCGRLQMRAQQ